MRSVLQAVLLLGLWTVAATAQESAVYDFSAAPLNRFEITLDVTLGTNNQTRTDSAVAQVSGSVDTVLDFDHAPATLTGIEFTGGSLSVTDLEFTFFWLFIGTIDITSTGVKGALSTPVPPGPVTGGAFNFGDHLLTATSGVVTVAFRGLILGLLPDIVLDFGAEPFSATIETNVPIPLVSGPVTGNQAAFTSVLSVPFAFDGDLFTNATLSTAATVGGTIHATSAFDVTLPPPVLDIATIPAPGADIAVGTPAEPGTTFRVDISDDLATWVPAATGTAASARFSYTDPDGSRPNARAYRLVIP